MKTRLEQLSRKLSVYDPIDLLKKLAALQTMPENADSYLRLEALVHVAASIPRLAHNVKISSNQLRILIQSKEIGDDVLHAEDPFNNLFTVNQMFYGGSYTVFRGIDDDTDFILKCLLKSLFFSPDLKQSKAYLKYAHDVTLSALLLSHLVTERSGLKRGVAPSSTPNGVPIVPDTHRLRQLSNAVSITREEIQQILLAHNLSIDSLTSLVTIGGTRKIARYEFEDGMLFNRPIVRYQSVYVLALPGRILPAIRHILLCKAIENGVAEVVGKIFGDAVWSSVTASLNYLDMHPLKINNLPPLDQPSLREGFFEFDADKVLHVMLISDPLDNYDCDITYGDWNDETISDQIASRIQQIQEICPSWDLPPQNILHLALVQSIGRAFAYEMRSPSDTHCLFMSPSDLETIALLEAGNSLALWQFALASYKLRERSRVQTFSRLDEYYHFRRLDYSYYFSDDARPNFVSISPDGAKDLRLEVIQRHDWHSILSYKGQVYTEVTALYSTPHIPIYVERKIIDSRYTSWPALAVEGYKIPIWVVSSSRSSEMPEQYHGYYSMLTDMVAYWLWQFTPLLSSIVEIISANEQRIILYLELADEEQWLSPPDTFGSANDTFHMIETDLYSCTLTLKLDASILEILNEPDNMGERQLVKAVIQRFRDFLHSKDQELLSESIIDSAIEKIAPLGKKKKAFILNQNQLPEADARSLPTFRSVQSYEKQVLLDELGTHLLTVEQLRIGSIDDDKRVGVLQKVVGFYYQKLANLVATLNSDNLIEILIAQHEALLQEYAEYSLTIPTSIACFGELANKEKDIIDRLQVFFEAGIASRFIIEYVTSKLPNGTQQFSLSIYDQLQAIASKMFSFATQSDLIYYGLSDIKMSMLPSERLGSDVTKFDDIKKGFLSLFAIGEIGRADKIFDLHWRFDQTEQGTDKLNKIAEELNLAFATDYKYPLKDHLELMDAAYSVGANIHPTVICLTYEDTVGRLATVLSWDTSKVTEVLDNLALRPRNDFFDTAPFDRDDVYPWRFNRALSYLRRPFLFRVREGTLEVLWGQRHIHSARTYLYNLCFSGRLRAKSDVLRKVLGKINNYEGELFNQQVANYLAKFPNLIIQVGVRKIGHLRLTNDSGDIGDIDVLIADPKQHILFLIECKDFSVARTPKEVANEFANLFVGDKSKVNLHIRRVEWVKHHVAETLSWLGINNDKLWEAQGIIVLNQELMSPLMHNPPLPVVPLTMLEQTMKL